MPLTARTVADRAQLTWARSAYDRRARLDAGGRPGVGDLGVGDHVDEVGAVRGERAAQGRGDLAGGGDDLARAAQGPDHLVVPAARLQVGQDVITVESA